MSEVVHAWLSFENIRGELPFGVKFEVRSIVELPRVWHFKVLDTSEFCTGFHTFNVCLFNFLKSNSFRIFVNEKIV